MKLNANDPRLEVVNLDDHELHVKFSGSVDGDVLTICGKDTKRKLKRVTETKFHGKNGKRTFIVETTA